MFINICWRKNDNVLKTLMTIEKASKFVQKLERSGINTWVELENIQKKKE